MSKVKLVRVNLNLPEKLVDRKKDKWVFFSIEYFDIIFIESRFIWKKILFNYW